MASHKHPRALAKHAVEVSDIHVVDMFFSEKDVGLCALTRGGVELKGA